MKVKVSNGTRIRKILGKTRDGELIVIEDSHKSPFNGLVDFGYWRMTPNTHEDIEDLNTEEAKYDYFHDLWKDAVQNDKTDEGYDDWVSQLYAYESILYPGDDESYRYETEGLYEELTDEQRENLFGTMSGCGIEESYNEETGEDWDFRTFSVRSTGPIVNDEIQCFMNELDYVADPELLKMIVESIGKNYEG